MTITEKKGLPNLSHIHFNPFTYQLAMCTNEKKKKKKLKKLLPELAASMSAQCPLSFRIVVSQP